MNRTHTIRNARTWDADGKEVVNYRQLFVEIIEDGRYLTTGTFDTKAAAYDFIGRWGARRVQRLTLDPMSASRAQLGLAGSRR